MKWQIFRDAPYSEMLELQRRTFNAMVERRKRGEPVDDLETVLMVEHRPVYTLGLHANAANLVNREFITSRGADVFEIERGGDVTFHGPGQLVVYPLIDFGSRGLGVKAYVDMLEEAVIRTIARYGIRGQRIPGATGVWVATEESAFPEAGKPADSLKPTSAKKICAIGVKCSRYVAMHGLALNVATDLDWFTAINPCGFATDSVTSLQRLLAASRKNEDTDRALPSWDDVATLFRNEFTALLNS